MATLWNMSNLQRASIFNFKLERDSFQGLFLAKMMKKESENWVALFTDKIE